ncbi:MAG TPA: hypothetical protein QF873_01235 [Patescibacteria group bacterium]|nr:hypothetical protein [Patescibacteria group bacterium]
MLAPCYSKVLVGHYYAHADEDVTMALDYLYGIRTFDLDGSRQGDPAKKVRFKTLSATELTGANRILLEKEMFWTFYGVFFGARDEHGKGQPGLAAATMPLEGMNEKELRVRFNKVMKKLGHPVKDLEAAWNRLEALRAYVAKKDNNASAHRFGFSWLWKQLSRMMCVNKKGELGERTLSEEQIREKVKMAIDIVLTLIIIPHAPSPGLDPWVEEGVCRWICANPDIRWPYRYEDGMTIADIIASIKSKGKTKARWLVRRLKSLQTYLYGMRTNAPYSDVNTRLFMRFLVTNPHLSIPEGLGYERGMTLEDVITKLRSLDKATPFRGEFLEGMGNLLQRREDEEDAVTENKGNSELDERDPSSPFGLHSIVLALRKRDGNKQLSKKLRSKGLAKKFLLQSLNTWWMHTVTEALGDEVAMRAEKNSMPIMVGGEKDGYIAVICSSNPTAPSRCFARGADMVINYHPERGHVYFGINHRKLGMESSNDIQRILLQLCRIGEWRIQERELPKDLKDLMAEGMLEDGTWHVATNEKGMAHTGSNGTIHHPKIPRTRLPRAVTSTLAWLVMTVFCRQHEVSATLSGVRELMVNTPIDDLPEKLLGIRSILTEQGKAA